MGPRKFNPGLFQSDAEVVMQFAVRHRELETVLEVLRGNVDSSSCQHVLVIGPRGRGKSMLLARVAAELRMREELSARLLPVRFMEENLEISSMADFWLEVLFQLGRECATHDPDHGRALKATHADLAGHRRERELTGLARAAVLSAADRLGRRLVLMVENLQSLCSIAEDDFGWQLRQELQSHPELMLLATATGRFEGLDDAKEPFFELFHIVDLRPLDEEECGRLWWAVTGDTAPSSDQLRALHVLTGGNPRLLVAMADLARHRSLSRLMESLVTLIDGHTDYFRSLLDSLSGAQQRVYVALLDLWQPSNASEIAARARLDIRVVSTMLGRLVDRGAVTVTGSRRKRLYSAAQRLHCIYYKLRREGGEAAVVRSVLRFMNVYYNESDREWIVRRALSDATQSPAISGALSRMFANHPRLAPLVSGPGHASGSSRPTDDVVPFVPPPAEEAAESSGPCETEVGSADGLGEHVFAAFQEQDYERVVKLADEVLDIEGGDWSPMAAKSLAVVSLVKATAQIALGDPDGAIVAFDTAISHIADGDEPDLQRLWGSASVLKGHALIAVRELDSAIVACNTVIERFDASCESGLSAVVAEALNCKGEALSGAGDFGAAIAAYDEVVERFGAWEETGLQQDVADALIGKGDALANLHRFAAAIAVYDAVIERHGARAAPSLREKVVRALIGKGFALEERGDLDAANAIYERIYLDFGITGGKDEVVRWWVNLARADRESALRRLGDYRIDLDEKFFRLVGGYDAPLGSELAAQVLASKGMRLARLGQAKEALQIGDEIERRLSSLTGERKAEAAWAADWMRTKALLVQGETSAALEVFRSACDRFVPDVDGMIRDAIDIVLDLVAVGAPVPDVVDILTSDESRSEALLPLVVALRQHAGEKTRAPFEVLEVASDIGDRIRERAEAAAGRSPGTGRGDG